MNRKSLLFLTVILISTIGYGQNCTCDSNFEWLKKTFEENAAEFQYVTDVNAQHKYNQHNAIISEEIKSVKNSTECTQLLSKWLAFFPSGHLSLRMIKEDKSVNDSTEAKRLNKEGIYETFKVDIPKFEKYLKTKTEVDFEGIWQTGGYKIGIKKDGENYIGFIITSAVDEWKPKQVKLKIGKSNDALKLIYYMRNHSAEECGSPEWIGKNYFHTNGFIFRRISPIFTDDSYIQNYFKFLNTSTPYLDTLGAKTFYFRIPGFDISYKQQIDSLININKDRILKTENLIIDLRNNGGGGGDSFKELIPLLYTNPIRAISAESRSTDLNNQYLLDIITNYGQLLSEETKQLVKTVYEKQKEQLGNFVNMSTEIVVIKKLDTIYPFPKNIGVIINKGCASATEDFLLSAKQSKKVKLFGVSTYGAVDYGNVIGVESPCNEYMLSYCMSKSLRLPNFVIDGVGIQPDYYIDKTISPYKWVEFVNDVLNEK